MLRGYALQSRRSAASSQEEALRAAGVTEIYIEDRTNAVFDAALKSLRAGDSIAVVALADLARNRRELRKRMDAIHERRCEVHETSTGRNSRKKTDLAAMIFDATEILTHAGKGHDPEKARQYGSRGGRPRKDRSISDADAEKHWFDIRHATNADAIKHMGKWTIGAAWRKWGASGRKTGPRREVSKPRKR